MQPNQIWDEFRAKLRHDNLTADDCCQHSKIDYSKFFQDAHTRKLKGFILRQESPKCELGEEKVIFTLKSSEKDEIRLDFLVRDNRWYFYMIDGLTIPIKKLPELPLSEFSAYPFTDRMRREDVITKQVYFYLKLKEEKSQEEALSWFRNGAGYKLNIEAWMPYFSIRKSFVLFTAWRENQYWGQEMVVEALSENHGVLLFKNHEYLMLYDVAGHLKPRINLQEYKTLFEDKWRDRANAVGWNIKFNYDNYDTRMVLDAEENPEC